MKPFLRSSGIRSVAMLLAVLLSLPMAWREFTGVYLKLSPFIMLNSALALKSLAWLSIPAIIILIVSYIKKRWFCRYACPVGWFCDNAARQSPRRKNYSRIPDFKIWLLWISLGLAISGYPVLILLDPLAIFSGFFRLFSADFPVAAIPLVIGLPLLIFSNLVFPFLWCNKICPLGGLQDELSTIRKRFSINKLSDKTVPGRPLNRRIFIAATAGVTAGLVSAASGITRKQAFLRPPGSVPENMFNFLCIRCGSCIKACPTGIIVSNTGGRHPAAWMTPEVSFLNNGYCPDYCSLCSSVCPSGAISYFTKKNKNLLKIGYALVDHGNCLLAGQSECNRCMESCSYQAINFLPSETYWHEMPVADNEKCTGCGACAAICPPLAITIIPLECH
jgi:ferredoxin-type protein NapF